jgi:enoyl-CoA hydratase/carnithine racemase
MAEENVVLFEKKGHVAIFTLNRPKAMNAVSMERGEGVCVCVCEGGGAGG